MLRQKSTKSEAAFPDETLTGGSTTKNGNLYEDDLRMNQNEDLIEEDLPLNQDGEY